MVPGISRIDALIQGALGGLALRQRVISDNVANVDTPGFKAGRVEFEDVLRQASNRNPRDGLSEAARTPQIVRRHDRSGQSDGNNVDVEGEMILLAETNIVYNALAQLAAGRLRLARHVISDGRR